MADDALAELNQRFGVGGKALEPDVFAELQSCMRVHHLSAQDLFFKWESYGMKMSMDDFRPSLDNVRAFKQTLLDDLERSNRSQAHIKTEKRVGATPRAAKGAGADVFGMLDGLTTPGPGGRRPQPKRTPAVSRVKAEPTSSPLRLDDHPAAATAASSFDDRPNPGEIIEIYNDRLPAVDPPISPFPEPRVKLTTSSDQKKLGYRGLSMKLTEVADILDDRIDEFTTLIAAHHNLDFSAFGSPASQGTTEIVAVGRIASDSLEGAKLSTSSLVLETPRKLGNARRVPLNLSLLKSYQFFPGQIVALRGINPSGREFTVHEILPPPLLSDAASTPDALRTHLDRLRGGPDAMDISGPPAPLTTLFAAGPYTADDNLLFEPLHTLCREAADTFVDAVVLTGPFIDADHPLIAAGDFDLPPEANYDPDTATMTLVFKYFISPALNRLVAANPSVTVLLVPSVRDVIDKHVSWPQDAFSRRELGLHKSVRIVGNPMTVAVNEMLVGVSSQDVLWELRHEELVGGVREEDALSRVGRYLIEQRHYFPLFPPVDRRRLPKTGAGAVGEGEAGVPPGTMLDVSYLELGGMVNVKPDVLVVPSALPPFAKVSSPFSPLEAVRSVLLTLSRSSRACWSSTPASSPSGKPRAPTPR